MRRTIAMFFKFLATGTFTLLIAACYGVAMQWKRITAKSPEGTAIIGLQVTLTNRSGQWPVETTDGSGSVEFTDFVLMDGAQAVIEDVDGPANGGKFATEQLTFDSRSVYVVTMKKE